MNRQEAFAEARRLVLEGLGYDAVAEAVGLPLSTIQKHAASEGWQKQREVKTRYSDQVRACKAGLLEMIMEFLPKCKTPEDLVRLAQLVNAWRSAEAAFPEHRYTTESDPKAAKLRRTVGIEVIEGLVELLSNEDPNALAVLHPHLSKWAEKIEREAA